MRLAHGVGTGSANNDNTGEASVNQQLSTGSQGPPLLNLLTFPKLFHVIFLITSIEVFLFLLFLGWGFSCCSLMTSTLITVAVQERQNFRTLRFFCGQKRVQFTFTPGPTTDTYWLQLQSSMLTE